MTENKDVINHLSVLREMKSQNIKSEQQWNKFIIDRSLMEFQVSMILIKENYHCTIFILPYVHPTTIKI